MAKKSKPGAIVRPFRALSQRVALKASSPPAQTPPKRPLAPVAVEQPHNDDELFLAAIAGAERLGEVEREPTVPKRRTPAYRPSEDELAMAELAGLCEGQGAFRTHESEEDYFGAAPGVSHTLLDNLRRGHYAVQHNIDLHGMNREEAHRALSHFISTARCRDGASCVLVVTGRGRSSPDGTSVLRESLPRWLSRAPNRAHVLAYATARPTDGGPGAFYVLLRRQGIAPFGQPSAC